MPDIEYGLTPQGPNIKRLDVILDELHTELSEKWGGEHTSESGIPRKRASY